MFFVHWFSLFPICILVYALGSFFDDGNQCNNVKDTLLKTRIYRVSVMGQSILLLFIYLCFVLAGSDSAMRVPKKSRIAQIT